MHGLITKQHCVLFREEGRSDFTICHLAELEGETLYLYGPGSLDALDRNWGQQIVNTVTTIAFKFIDYDDIVPHLGKIHGKYPVIQVRYSKSRCFITHEVLLQSAIFLTTCLVAAL